jgi:hypothetical protein
VAINVKLGGEEEVASTEDNSPLKVIFKKDDPDYPVKLRVRKTLEGNLMIFDHRDIDIVIMPAQLKIVAFPKYEMGSHVYDAEDRLFRFLHKMGVIKYGTVQGGAVYNSMQADIPQSSEYNAVDYVLFAIERFVDTEKPHFAFEEEFYKEFEQSLTQPDAEDATTFDPSRQAPEKGSIRPGLQPYGVASIYRL